MGIVDEVSTLICDLMAMECLPKPDQATWLKNAEEFENLGFPRAVGAIDGKHFWCKKPTGTGSMYYNYKGYFSVVMLAVIDAHARFLLVDIGAAGRNSDSTLFMNSPIRAFLESPQAEIPREQPLGTVGEVPFVILGDGGFGLSDYLMTPFPVPTTNTPEKAQYNLCLSRARRIVENAFGQLVSRFHLFSRILEMEPGKAKKLIYSGVILHNFLGPEVVDFDDEHANLKVVQLQQQRTPAATRRARLIRDRFVEYFQTIFH